MRFTAVHLELQALLGDGLYHVYDVLTRKIGRAHFFLPEKQRDNCECAEDPHTDKCNDQTQTFEKPSHVRTRILPQ
jgi:hypothetical protein